MAPIDFYYMPGSPPCRAVQLVAKALKLELNLHLTDITKGETVKPEFLKMNPQHTLPTMKDNDFCLWESRAIMAYMVNKYGSNKDDSLYPKCPKTRALVDQRLYFDLSSLYGAFADCYYPVLMSGAPVDEKKVAKVADGLKFLDTFLDASTFAACDHLTIADLALITSVTTIEAMGTNIKSYPNVARWAEKVKQTAPGYEEVSGQSLTLFKGWVDSVKAGK